MQIAIVSFVLFFAVSTPAKEFLAQGSHLLKLQIVDPDWVPVSGATVIVQRVSDCGELMDSAVAPHRIEIVTDARGSSDVLLAPGEWFVVTVPAFGHLEHQSRCLKLPIRGSEANWVQIRLRTNWLVATGLSHPSVTEKADLTTAPIAAFAGVYQGRNRDLYRVIIDSAATGITVEFPSAEIVRLPKRSGASFEGEHGSVRFTVRDARLELIYSPRVIVATKAP